MYARMEHDREEKFNMGLFRQVGELGFIGVTVPEEYGGSGLDATASAIIHEELAAGARELGAHLRELREHVQRQAVMCRPRWQSTSVAGAALACSVRGTIANLSTPAGLRLGTLVLCTVADPI